MPLEKRPAFEGTMRGTIWCYTGPPLVDHIGVVVEFRPPAMHCIVEVSGDGGWCGVARVSWR